MNNMDTAEHSSPVKLEKKKREKFYIEPESIFVKLSIIIMVFSFVLRFVGTLGMWSDSYFAITQIALPLCVNVMYVVFLYCFGKRAFWVTTLPALLGVVFFIIKALTFDSLLHTVLCILLYALVAVLYTGTAFGFIRSKWLLVPLFGLPFVYHIFVEDLAAFREGTISFQSGLQEMSVLCIMLSLLCVAFALKKKKADVISPESELPKMKDPVIILNKSETGENTDEKQAN